jgi:hypothetical protein
MLERIKQKWVEWLVSVVLVFLTVILTNHFMLQRDQKTSIERQIEMKADKVYVDQQDMNIKDQIRQHESDQKILIDQLNTNYKSIDKKLDILLNKGIQR